MENLMKKFFPLLTLATLCNAILCYGENRDNNQQRQGAASMRGTEQEEIADAGKESRLYRRYEFQNTPDYQQNWRYDKQQFYGGTINMVDQNLNYGDNPSYYESNTPSGYDRYTDYNVARDRSGYVWDAYGNFREGTYNNNNYPTNNNRRRQQYNYQADRYNTNTPQYDPYPVRNPDYRQNWEYDSSDYLSGKDLHPVNPPSRRERQQPNYYHGY